MVLINGKLNKAIAGKVRATPDQQFIDSSTTPDTIVALPYEAEFTGGEFSIDLPQSQSLAGQTDITTSGVTYKIELLEKRENVAYYFSDGSIYTGLTHKHTDDKYYTGSVNTDSSVVLDRVETTDYIDLQDPIHAIIPDSPSPIEYSSLIAIPFNASNRDISIYRIAEILTQEPKYRDRISSKFQLTGQYSNTKTYEFGDIVYYNGGSWVFRRTTSASGIVPASGDAWQKLADKGEPGGTGAQIVGYDSATWDGSTEAAARGDVQDAIASIPNPDLSNYLTIIEGAPRDSPVFTGKVKRDVMTFPSPDSDKLTEIPTVDYVERAIASLGVGGFPKPLIFARLTETVNIGQDFKAQIAWDSKIINSGDILDNAGAITIGEEAGYLFYVSFTFEIRTNFNSGSGQQRARATGRLANRTNSNNIFTVGDFFNYNGVWANNTTYTFKQQGLRFEPSLSKATKLAIEAVTTRDGTATSIFNYSSVGGSGANNFLAVWKVG